MIAIEVARKYGSEEQELVVNAFVKANDQGRYEIANGLCNVARNK